MVIYCNQKLCKWNEDGECADHKQQAGHFALYIEATLGGQAICADMEYKEGWEEEYADY